MKNFTIFKIGYSKGQSGCTGEYFTAVVCNDKGMQSISFSGIYGGDSRISRILKDKGYTESYTQSLFGKLTRKETRFTATEEEAVEWAKNL